MADQQGLLNANDPPAPTHQGQAEPPEVDDQDREPALTPRPTTIARRGRRPLFRA